MKQRYLVGKMNDDEKEGAPDEVTMESLGQDGLANLHPGSVDLCL